MRRRSCQDEEHVQDLKADRRNGKKVYGHKGLDVVVKEGSPGLRWRLSVSDQILAHARLPDVDAELQKLAVNTRRSPAWVLFAHATDQIANFARDRRATRLAAADLQPPEEAKRLAVPGNDRFWLVDDQRRTPVCPNAGQPNPQESVSYVPSRSLLDRALKNPDLMPECDISSCSAARVFRADEAPASKCASDPDMNSTILRIKAKYHDLSHFGAYERDSRFTAYENRRAAEAAARH
jgi:hypothetical protein